MILYTSLYFPNIDRLTDRFPTDSVCFFKELSDYQRKQLKKYLNFKLSKHQDNWSFTDTTYRTLEVIDAAALKFYLEKLKYTQLKLKL